MKKNIKVPVKKPQKQLSGFVALIIILLPGILIYSNTFSNSFHLDDYWAIVTNQVIRDISDLPAIWKAGLNRPVAFITYALNYNWTGLNVWSWHLVNISIHLINGCIVWWLTLLILSTPAVNHYKIVAYKKEIALFTALLFITHPLATQSVTYIVQRMTSLAALFYLLSIVLYVKFRLSNGSNTIKAILVAGCVMAAFAAMRTKENTFTLPVAILLTELAFMRSQVSQIRIKHILIFVAIILSLGIIVFFALDISLNIFSTIPPSANHTVPLDPASYLLTQFSVIVKYIQLLIVPANQMVDYSFPISQSFFELRTIGSFVLLAALLALAIYLYKKNRIVSFGIFWFFITLAIESSIIPINDVIYEHRTYLPSFGYFIIITTILYYYLGEKHRYTLMILLSVIIGIHSILTFERNKTWKDDLTLWTDNIEKAPDCPRPYSLRGHAYFDLGDYEKALSDFTKSIQLNPNFADPYLNRGNTYGTLKEWDKSIADFSKAIELDPMLVMSYKNRGKTYAAIQQWDKAVADFTKAIEINPYDAEAYNERGIVYKNTSQLDKAIADYSKAIEFNPNNPLYYYNRGFAYGLNQEQDYALADYSTVLEMAPEYINALFNRGIIYQNKGEFAKSVSDFSSAIQLSPGSIELYMNRGAAYYALQKYDNAIADYTSAININPKIKEFYINRGLAYGEAGKWDKAAEDFNTALTLDPAFSIAYDNREKALKNLRK